MGICPLNLEGEGEQGELLLLIQATDCVLFSLNTQKEKRMAPLASNSPLSQGTWRLIYHFQTKETLAAGLFNTQKITLISGTLLRMQPLFIPLLILLFPNTGANN